MTATLQCTGNRRTELSAVAPIKGLEWEGGAIGTAVWGGARLADVLVAAGLSPDDPEVAHIQFEGLDRDMAGVGYGASIPARTACDPAADVLLAYEMNGAALPPDHGAPLRVVVPGTAGCRSVKWVGRVVASGEESGSFWQREDYKSFSPSTGWDTVDWASAPSIQAMPVTSLICEPARGAAVDDEEVEGAWGEWSGWGVRWSGGSQGEGCGWGAWSGGAGAAA